MQVAAVRAVLDRGRRQSVLVRPFGRQKDPVDEVARALVVDDAARPELGDREETRPLQELVASLPIATRRDEGREWEAREAVARQEALAREITVAVEVRL